MVEPIFRDVRVARKKDDVKKDFDAAKDCCCVHICNCCVNVCNCCVKANTDGCCVVDDGCCILTGVRDLSAAKRPSQLKGLSANFCKAISKTMH